VGWTGAAQFYDSSPPPAPLGHRNFRSDDGQTRSHRECSKLRRVQLTVEKGVPRAKENAHRALLAAASVYVAVYLFIALRSLWYRFELEWLEGGSVVHVQRILDGQPLYVAPSLDFVPFNYSPLYFYVSAMAARITGNGFLPLRLVSIASSIGCLVLIFLTVHRRTRSRSASFLGACLFAATFEIAGSWFDLARVDSLALFLLLAGIHAFESRQPLVRSLASPVLLFLSFFTKQTALAVGASLSLAVLVTGKRYERLWFPLIFGILVAVSTLVANALTTDWYSYYVFDLYREHQLIPERLISFWTADVIRPLALALCVSIIPFLNLDDPSPVRADRTVQDVAVLFGLFLGSYFARIHEGSYNNVLMPAYAGVAIYFGIGWARMMSAAQRIEGLGWVAILVAALQFAGLAYWPPRELPSSIDSREGEKLEQLIGRFPGDVYLSDHPWYLGRVNRGTQAHDMALRDVLRGPAGERWKAALEHTMAAAVAREKYDAFIVDLEDFTLRVPDFEKHYRLVDSHLTGDAFYPVTGRPDRKPTYLYVRRGARQDEPTR
jgi:hypothetical protein